MSKAIILEDTPISEGIRVQVPTVNAADLQDQLTSLEEKMTSMLVELNLSKEARRTNIAFVKDSSEKIQALHDEVDVLREVCRSHGLKTPQKNTLTTAVFNRT